MFTSRSGVAAVRPLLSKVAHDMSYYCLDLLEAQRKLSDIRLESKSFVLSICSAAPSYTNSDYTGSTTLYKCSCRLYTAYGLACCHVFAVSRRLNRPDMIRMAILPRWFISKLFQVFLSYIFRIISAYECLSQVSKFASSYVYAICSIFRHIDEYRIRYTVQSRGAIFGTVPVVSLMPFVSLASQSGSYPNP